MSSEWIFRKYFSLEGLDNTFIITGYLKSIEQLLWNIISLKGVGKQISSGKGKPRIELSDDNHDEIDKTLGSLQFFITNFNNSDLFLGTLGNSVHFVQKYLFEQISVWRELYRNGYFHKHNLTDISRINDIREETLYLYMLILGSMKLENEDIKILSE